MLENIDTCEGFQWDDGNSGKNWKLHHVADSECEQLFFNKPLMLIIDEKHSQLENRWYALGKTDAQRLLLIVFTIRKNVIRVISARDMNNKERKIYCEKVQKYSKI
jgi:uncharacterized protein